MAIVKTVTRWDFEDSFRRVRAENFSYAGLKTLYDYLEQLSEDLGEDIELDVIALCCEYSEYKNLKELQEDYPDVDSMDDLESNTLVIPIDGTDGFIIQQY